MIYNNINFKCRQFEVKGSDTQIIGFYSNKRVTEIPDGMHKYELRGHSVNSKALTIEPRVVFNFCGTILTNEPIEFPDANDKFIKISKSKFIDEDIVRLKN